MIKYQFLYHFIFYIDILSLFWYNENVASPRLCQIALNGQRQFDTGNAKYAMFSLPALF